MISLRSFYTIWHKLHSKQAYAWISSLGQLQQQCLLTYRKLHNFPELLREAGNNQPVAESTKLFVSVNPAAAIFSTPLHFLSCFLFGSLPIYCKSAERAWVSLYSSSNHKNKRERERKKWRENRPVKTDIGKMWLTSGDTVHAGLVIKIWSCWFQRVSKIYLYFFSQAFCFHQFW